MRSEVLVMTVLLPKNAAIQTPCQEPAGTGRGRERERERKVPVRVGFNPHLKEERVQRGT